MLDQYIEDLRKEAEIQERQKSLQGCMANMSIPELLKLSGVPDVGDGTNRKILGHLQAQQKGDAMARGGGLAGAISAGVPMAALGAIDGLRLGAGLGSSLRNAAMQGAIGAAGGGMLGHSLGGLIGGRVKQSADKVREDDVQLAFERAMKRKDPEARTKRYALGGGIAAGLGGGALGMGAGTLLKKIAPGARGVGYTPLLGAALLGGTAAAFGSDIGGTIGRKRATADQIAADLKRMHHKQKGLHIGAQHGFRSGVQRGAMLGYKAGLHAGREKTSGVDIIRKLVMG